MITSATQNTLFQLKVLICLRREENPSPALSEPVCITINHNLLTSVNKYLYIQCHGSGEGLCPEIVTPENGEKKIC